MDETETVRRQVTLAHRNGLHLAPIQRVVKVASSSCVTIHHGEKSANAGSAMELMLLGATHGAPLLVEGSGPDAGAAVAAVVAILEIDSDPDS